LPKSDAVEKSDSNGTTHEMELRMAMLRDQLHRDAQACREARKRWIDWRSHLRAHPWLVSGAAAVVGYALVPHRRKTANPVPIAVPGPPVHSGGLVSSVASALFRRAAQQALGIGAAWALERLRAGALNGPQPDPEQTPPDVYAAAALPSEYAHD